MSIPTTRDDFKNYCLRMLGDGVIKVNVSEDQVDDCVDYALQKFMDYHFDGSFRSYYQYQIQAADITNGYFTIPSTIRDVVSILPLSTNLMGVGIFNLQYQFVFTSLDVYRYMDLTNWVSTMQNIQQMEQLLVGITPIRYDRYGNTVYLDIDWTLLNAGDYLIVECFIGLDSSNPSFSKIWSDAWLQRYTTAQIKERWGRNLSKYQGVPLVGGVALNGAAILNEALAEIMDLEERMRLEYSVMPLDCIG